MKYAFFSDVHGNINALIAVYKSIKERSIENIIFLGDAIKNGNYEEDDHVVEFLKDNKIVMIKGNHDRVGENKELSPENIDFLEKAREYIIKENILAFHSSLRSPDNYLFRDYEINREHDFIMIHFGEFRFHLFGHTHERALFSISKYKSLKTLPIVPITSLDQDLSYFINPGALCSLENNDRSYAVLDTTCNTLEFINID